MKSAFHHRLAAVLLIPALLGNSLSASAVFIRPVINTPLSFNSEALTQPLANFFENFSKILKVHSYQEILQSDGAAALFPGRFFPTYFAMDMNSSDGSDFRDAKIPKSDMTKMKSAKYAAWRSAGFDPRYASKLVDIFARQSLDTWRDLENALRTTAVHGTQAVLTRIRNAVQSLPKRVRRKKFALEQKETPKNVGLKYSWDKKSTLGPPKSIPTIAAPAMTWQPAQQNPSPAFTLATLRLKFNLEAVRRHGERRFITYAKDHIGIAEVLDFDPATGKMVIQPLRTNLDQMVLDINLVSADVVVLLPNERLIEQADIAAKKWHDRGRRGFILLAMLQRIEGDLTPSAEKLMNILREVDRVPVDLRKGATSVYRDKILRLMENEVPSDQKAFAWMIGAEVVKVHKNRVISRNPETFFKATRKETQDNLIKLAAHFVEMHDKVLNVEEVYRVLEGKPLDERLIWRKRNPETDDIYLERAAAIIAQKVIFGIHSAILELGAAWTEDIEGVISAGVELAMVAHGQFDVAAFTDRTVPAMARRLSTAS